MEPTSYALLLFTECLRTCCVLKTKQLPYITTKFRKPFTPTEHYPIVFTIPQKWKYYRESGQQLK